ncbi:MAG: fluoride efflux transporter CrcB [Candidatus Omnitrophica bacterium]|nr:fluoride efflux transporter CrcB [Candidatus Omnitrophota bacterium]
MEKWLYLIAGGIVGTVSRYALAGVVSQKVGTAFPWGTLAVNLVGCFVIGFLDVIFERKFLIIHNYRILLMTGFCGAFTTLSGIMLEISDLAKKNEYGYVCGYVVLTICVGFILFKVGAAFAELL